MSITVYYQHLRDKKQKERSDEFIKESKWDFLTYLWLAIFLLTLLLFGRFTAWGNRDAKSKNKD